MVLGFLQYVRVRLLGRTAGVYFWLNFCLLITGRVLGFLECKLSGLECERKGLCFLSDGDLTFWVRFQGSLKGFCGGLV